ncbi:protein-methionine sulfoxide oxidase mical3b-like [Thalassophryne amazonica]|uniref:protein-methionine sulfoxide oxidase mical3b-like n=1 Tax=Thalassophryne amazonica TaxID=390379 RepID=UPI0014718973|nr:protein-methionine sulfoxide oxidase mical3b-like [Thalassophryne amazonica]
MLLLQGELQESAQNQTSTWRPKKRTQQQEQMSFRFRQKIKSQTLLGSVEPTSAGSGGSSDVCFFCNMRVYVMERLSAEGLFFHRTCFECEYCGSTLHLTSYAYDELSRRFYCPQHYDMRLSAPTARKRAAASLATDLHTSHRNSIVRATDDH